MPRFLLLFVSSEIPPLPPAIVCSSFYKTNHSNISSHSMQISCNKQQKKKLKLRSKYIIFFVWMCRELCMWYTYICMWVCMYGSEPVYAGTIVHAYPIWMHEVDMEYLWWSFKRESLSLVHSSSIDKLSYPAYIRHFPVCASQLLSL